MFNLCCKTVYFSINFKIKGARLKDAMVSPFGRNTDHFYKFSQKYIKLFNIRSHFMLILTLSFGANVLYPSFNPKIYNAHKHYKLLLYTYLQIVGLLIQCISSKWRSSSESLNSSILSMYM